MCGIYGVFDDKVDIRLAEQSSDLLIHRGPDQKGSLTGSEDTYYLGFSRLAFQDLSKSGNQPMQSADGKVMILFNGEIYNFIEIRNELIDQGYEFRSTSDTEVILASYLVWGLERTLNSLDGMFAMMIFDLDKSELYLVRDRLGIKPLYYWISNGKFQFSSEIKPIIKYANGINIQIGLNYPNLLQAVLFTSLPRTRETNFEGINRVMPGEVVTLSVGDMSVQTRNYFELLMFVNESQYRANVGKPRKVLARELDCLLEKSIRTTLVSDTPVGVMFSGGLDSTIVAIKSQMNSQSTIPLFTYMNEDSITPTEIYEREYEKPVNKTFLDNKSTLENLGSLIFATEDINKAEAWVLGEVCSNAKRSGVKALLTGDGADELFGGYNDHAEFYLRSKLLNSRLGKRTLISARTFGFSEFSGLFPSVKPSELQLIGLPLDIMINGSRGVQKFQEARSAYQFEKREHINDANALLFDEVQFWIERFLLRADRYSMRNSVEIRLPFLRNDIVAFALNVPFDKKVKLLPSISSKRPYQTKVILREVAQMNKLPRVFFKQRKIGTKFTSQNLVDTLFNSWNFDLLESVFGFSMKFDNNSYMFNLLPERLKVSLLSGDIFLRIFLANEPVDNINQDIKEILIKCA